MIQVNSNELRLHNWITGNGKCFRVYEETFFDIKSTYGDFEPIPLTTVILELAGFEKRPDGNYWLYQYNTGTDSYIDISLMQARVGEVVISPRIEYVHQLQNLYFALTQTELEINL